MIKSFTRIRLASAGLAAAGLAMAVGAALACQGRSKNRPCGGVKVGHLWRVHETAGRA